MEQVAELNDPSRIQDSLSSICFSCFKYPQVRFRQISQPPRLEDMALQAIARIIEGYRDVILKADHCSLLEDVFPVPAQTLVRDVTFATLKRRAHEKMDWESTEIELKLFLNCLAAVESEFGKMNDQKSASNEHKPLASEGESSGIQDVETVNPFQIYTNKYGPFPPNVYSVSEVMFKYMREHKHLDCSDWYKLFENLQEIPESLQILQRSKGAIQQFLDTGPHLCLDEKECEFLQGFVEQVPQVFANQLVELLGWPLKCETSKDKRILASLVHPAVTKIQVPHISNEVSLHLFLNVAPKLKLLQQLSLSITVILCKDRRYLDKTENEILTSLNSNSSLKELRLHLVKVPVSSIDREFAICKLWQRLEQLPATLRLMKFHGSTVACTVQELNAMACSGRFCSLYCLSLDGIDCSNQLQKGFQHLEVMELEKVWFKPIFFLKDVGSQLHTISLHFVYSLVLHDLAKACPLLQFLIVKRCSICYDYEEPKPEFKCLKELHFICNEFTKSITSLYARRNPILDDLYIAYALRHSFQLQKLEIITGSTDFSECLRHLCMNKNISEVTEIEVYRHNREEVQGLLSREMVDQVLKHCNKLYLVGGIENVETKIALSEIYPRISFVCMSQNLKKHFSEELMRFFEDKVVLLPFFEQP